MSIDPVLARVGTRLGERWVLEGLIGQGGVASVYSARDLDGTRVAVKILDPTVRPFLAQRPDLRALFSVEATVARTVAHPSVVRVLAEGEAEDALPFVVMEFLDGSNLETLRGQAGSLGIEVVVAVVQQVLDLFKATHQAGIVHCDIKPANLLVTREGALKVLDFGVSNMTFRERKDQSAITAAGAMLMGTPSYCAPEICRGNPGAREDPRVDIWSLGATAFELLTGRTVHLGETVMETLYRGATEKAPPVASLNSRIPGVIADVVDKALAFEPGQRWQTASDMADALEGTWPALGCLRESALSNLVLLASKR